MVVVSDARSQGVRRALSAFGESVRLYFVGYSISAQWAGQKIYTHPLAFVLAFETVSM